MTHLPGFGCFSSLTPDAPHKLSLSQGMVKVLPSGPCGVSVHRPLVALSGHQSQRRFMSALGRKADIPILAHSSHRLRPVPGVLTLFFSKSDLQRSRYV